MNGIAPACGWVFLALLLPGAGSEGDNAREASAIARGLVDAARKTYEAYEKDFYEGRGIQENVYRWSRRWLKAQVAIAKSERERVTAAEAHLARMTRLEKMARKRLDARVAPLQEYTAASYYRLRAEDVLRKTRQEKAKDGPD